MGQLDFDFPTHRALLQCGLSVVIATGLPPDGVLPRAALALPLSTMVNVGELEPALLDAAVRDLAAVYRVELFPPTYLHLLPEFLTEQRALHAVRHANVSTPAALAESLQEAVRGASVNPSTAETADIDEELAEAEIPVPCGLPIDAEMNGGLGRGRAALICMATGLGKTSWAINQQRGNAMFGFRAALFSLELPGNEIKSRRQSCCSGVEYNHVQYAGQTGMPSREEVRAQVRDGILNWTGADAYARMVTFDYSQREATIESIDADLSAQADAGTPVDMAFIDWLECLELPAQNRGSLANKIPVKELRHKLEIMGGRCSQLAQKHNLALYVFTQSTFAVQEKAHVGLNDKSEGKGASRRFSYFIGGGMSPEDRKNNVMTLTCGKARNGRTWKIQVRRALHVQRFEQIEN